MHFWRIWRPVLLLNLKLPSILKKLLLVGWGIFAPWASSTGVGLVSTDPGPAIYWFSSAAASTIIAVFLWDEVLRLAPKWRSTVSVIAILVVLFSVWQADRWVARKAEQNASATTLQAATDSRAAGSRNVKAKATDSVSITEDMSHRKHDNVTATKKSTPKESNSPKSAGRSDLPKQTQQNAVLLAATFTGPTQPSIAIYNPSEEVVENVLWEMVAFRASDLCMFSFATQAIGFIKAESSSANYAMQLATIPKITEPPGCVLKPGDELTGSVSIDCAHCSSHAYIIHLVWGQSGWYFESPIKGGLALPKNMSNDGRLQYIQTLTGEQFAAERAEIR